MKTPMENARQNRHDDRPRAGVTQVADHGRAVATAVEVVLPRAEELARQNFLTLPAWFGCGQACAVLRLKGRSFVLLSDERGVKRLASLERLAAAPPDRGIGACATPLGPSVPLTTPADRALRLMDAHGSDHAAVTSGGVLVGILSRDAAAAAIVEASTRIRGIYDEKSSSAVPGRLAA